MKKKYLALLLTAGMILGVAGCGNSGAGTQETGTTDQAESTVVETETPAATAEGTTGEVVEVTIPSYKTGENSGAVFFEPQVERFNEAYAGQYKITLEATPQDTFNDKLKQLAQQNQLPVLVQGGDVDWISKVVIPNGLAYNLSGWLNENAELKGRLLEDGIEYNTQDDGAIYTMPLATVRPTGFFYNSALWTPSGDVSAMSIDEFVSDLADQKIAFSTAENGWVAALFYTALIANEDGGAELLQNGTVDKIIDFNQTPIIEATKKLQTLLQNNASSNSIGATYADAANAFMSEQAAVIANGPWMSAEFAPESSDKWSNGFDGANVHASLFPGNVGVANTRTYGEWWISASASDEEAALAKAFLEFINSPEELEAYLLAEGGDAPNLEYSDSFKEKQAETQVLADLAADTTSDTVFVPAVLDVIPASVANTEFGKLLPSLADGTYTAEEFCQWLSDKAAEAVEE